VGFKAIPPDLLVIVLADDPADARVPAVVQVQEVHKGFLKVEDDGTVVLELQSRAQAERRLGKVGRHLGLLGQAIRLYPLWHGLNQGIVDQVVVVLPRPRRDVLEGIQPAGVQRIVLPMVNVPVGFPVTAGVRARLSRSHSSSILGSLWLT
jgi:hypothetical protein